MLTPLWLTSDSLTIAQSCSHDRAYAAVAASIWRLGCGWKRLTPLGVQIQVRCLWTWCPLSRLLASTWLGEEINQFHIIGGVMVISGVILIIKENQNWELLYLSKAGFLGAGLNENSRITLLTMPAPSAGIVVFLFLRFNCSAFTPFSNSLQCAHCCCNLECDSCLMHWVLFKVVKGITMTQPRISDHIVTACSILSLKLCCHSSATDTMAKFVSFVAWWQWAR